MSARSLPARPHLDQLKRQAKELLRRQPDIGRLRDAQRVTAEGYGFTSWDALRRHVESIVGATDRSISSHRNSIRWRGASSGMHSPHRTMVM